MGIQVVFQPEGKRTKVQPGANLRDVAAELGMVIHSPCGGKGTCGKCLVHLVRGASPPNRVERQHISQKNLDRGYRLACQMTVQQDCTVTIPLGSRFFGQKILISGMQHDTPVHPDVRKAFVRVPEPTVEDNIADMDRLSRQARHLGVEDLSADADVMAQLPATLRQNDSGLTLVIHGNRLLGVERGDTAGELHGMAFDVGTTTVVGTLLDLNTGNVLGVASRMNEQAAFGEDVMSRINYCITNEGGRQELKNTVIRVLNEITTEVCDRDGISLERIYEIAVVGNTTMHHLLLGIDPVGLSASPYVPACSQALETPARDLGLFANPQAYVHTLPNIAGFVGSDTVAVLLACGLMDSDTPKLAIDIGTNGEMVVGSKDRMVSCSTAAGPAFEGAHISQGMRAASGAIERVVIEDGRIHLGVIDDVHPTGVCGSGLFDAVAELLKVGVIGSSGRMRSAGQLDERVSPEIKSRIVPSDRGNSFVLVQPDAGYRPVILTQKDVREVQLAKGAVHAGIQMLLRELGLGVEDLDEIMLAGAFGNYIRKESALRVGILPQVSPDRIKFIGNAASTGAQMALVSAEAKKEAQRIARFTQYIELAGRPDFQAEFMEAMMF